MMGWCSRIYPSHSELLHPPPRRRLLPPGLSWKGAAAGEVCLSSVKAHRRNLHSLSPTDLITAATPQGLSSKCCLEERSGRGEVWVIQLDHHCRHRHCRPCHHHHHWHCLHDIQIKKAVMLSLKTLDSFMVTI